MKISPSYMTALINIRKAIDETGQEYVTRGQIAAHMGRLPRPNTLQGMIKKGLLVQNPSVSYGDYKPADAEKVIDGKYPGHFFQQGKKALFSGADNPHTGRKAELWNNGFAQAKRENDAACDHTGRDCPHFDF